MYTFHTESRLSSFFYSYLQSKGSATKTMQSDQVQNQFPCWIVALNNGSWEDEQFLQFLQESVIMT